MTRTRLVQIWFAAVAVVGLCGIVLGATVMLSTGVLLLALCLAPPVILLFLWPSVQPPTAADVLHGPDVRS
jgi:hypothetical protein